MNYSNTNSRKGRSLAISGLVILVVGLGAYWLLVVRSNSQIRYGYFDVTAKYKLKGHNGTIEKHFISNVVEVTRLDSDEKTTRKKNAAILQIREKIAAMPDLEYISNVSAPSDSYRRYEDATNAMYKRLQGYDGEQSKGYLTVETFSLRITKDQ